MNESHQKLHRYAGKRFVARMIRSGYAEDFLVRDSDLFKWTATRAWTAEELETLFMKFCCEPVEEDGLVFLVLSVKVEERADGKTQVSLEARKGSVRIPLHVDIEVQPRC